MKSVFRLLGCVAVVTVSGCHCKPTTNNSLFGEVGVVYTQSDGTVITGSNGTYDFGKIGMGTSTTKTITIKNLGTGALDLQSVAKASGDNLRLGAALDEEPPTFIWDFVATTIGIGESYQMDATFNAPIESDSTITSKDHQAVVTLTLGNTMPGDDTSTITLQGTAISGQCDLPQRIDFGAVAVNDTFSKTVTILNNSPIGANASVGTITSNSGDDTSFGFGPDSPTGNFTVGAGSMRNVVLTFTPTMVADYLAFVKMRAADQCPEVTVTLVGSGVSTVLACDPNPVDFGYLTPGLSTQQTLKLTNEGFAPISVTGAATKVGTTASTEFKLLGPDTFTVPAATRDASSNLVPGTITLNLSFTPALLGTRQGQLVAGTSLTKEPMLSCALRGVGGGPDIDVKPTALDFGQIPFFGNTQPFFATRKITIQNLGTAPTPPDPKANLHLGQGGVGPKYWDVVAKNANSPLTAICVGDYNTSTGACSNAPPAAANYVDATGIVAAGAAALLDIPVRVQPIASGVSMEWDVTIYSDDPDEPAVVVNVKAQSVLLPPCNYAVTPTTLNFGLVTPPAYRDLSFAVTNLGVNPNETCLILSLDLKAGTDPTFSLPAGPITQQMMQPGQTVTVTVRASPQTTASATAVAAVGAIQIGMSSPTMPETDVALQASIATSCLVISPNDLDFGTVEKGCKSAKHTFNVYNTCSSNVTVVNDSMQSAAGLPAGAPGCTGSTPCP